MWKWHIVIARRSYVASSFLITGVEFDWLWKFAVFAKWDIAVTRNSSSLTDQRGNYSVRYRPFTIHARYRLPTSDIKHVFNCAVTLNSKTIQIFIAYCQFYRPQWTADVKGVNTVHLIDATSRGVIRISLTVFCHCYPNRKYAWNWNLLAIVLAFGEL